MFKWPGRHPRGLYGALGLVGSSDAVAIGRPSSLNIVKYQHLPSSGVLGDLVGDGTPVIREA